MATKTLKAGVIGTGMGRYHMEGFASHPRCELLAVCDLNELEAEEFAQKYGASHVFADYREMLKLKELDLVGIAVPNFLHAPMTLAALQAGCHVLCEKPMALTVAQAEQMAALARRKKKRLMIDMSQRFGQAQRTLFDLATKRNVGEVYYAKASWIRRKGTPVLDFPPGGSMGRGPWFVNKKQAGGGALFDIGVHLYDLAWWIMGAPVPVSVMASTYDLLSQPRFKRAKVFADIDDLASALVKFDNGATMFVEVSWDSHMEPGSYVQIFGTKGGLSWVGGEVKFHHDVKGKPVSEKIDTGKTKTESAYHHFIDCVLNPRKKMIASAAEGLQVVKVLTAIDRSARTGKAVTIK